jgi:hypothetical protein
VARCETAGRTLGAADYCGNGADEIHHNAFIFETPANNKGSIYEV